MTDPLLDLAAEIGRFLDTKDAKRMSRPAREHLGSIGRRLAEMAHGQKMAGFEDRPARLNENVRGDKEATSLVTALLASMHPYSATDTLNTRDVKAFEEKLVSDPDYMRHHAKKHKNPWWKGLFG